MIKRLIKYIIQHTDKKQKVKNDSTVINDIDLITSFLANPDFPWLISFPRTGSHWLRMVMELYFEKPSLVRIFFHENADDFTCIHRHDVRLRFNGCRNVIYLYRDPVDTVYSQIKFDKEDVDNVGAIQHWTELYAKHLNKWLVEEKFTKIKTVISYEEMKTDFYRAFEKVCRHFNESIDNPKLAEVLSMVTKSNLKKVTEDEPRTVNLSTNYDEQRAIFRVRHCSLIYDLILKKNKELKKYFHSR